MIFKKSITLALFAAIVPFILDASENYLRVSFDGQSDASAKISKVRTAKGVVGNAGNFNEFDSVYKFENTIKLKEPFTVSAWVSPRLRPINTAAFVSQSDGEFGWLVGINRDGCVEIMYSPEGAPLVSIRSPNPLPLFRWSHVAVKFNSDSIELYINSKKILSRAGKSFRGKVAFADVLIEIGRTPFKMPIKTITAGLKKHAGLLGVMRFDGLLDEIVISDNDSEIAAAAKSGKIGTPSGLDFVKLPATGDMRGEFGAFYANLKYETAWDSLWRVESHPDIVVRFPDIPVKYVFWRGMGFVPVWITENDIWLTDQSLENFRNKECSEVMSDKQCRYSHVRIIESTPARCIVHWRYAMTNVLNEIRDEDETGWGEWVDEYFYVYPDGVGIREQILHSSLYEKRQQWGYQFQETILINQAGTTPKQNLETDAMSFSDMDGNTASYSWLEKNPNFDKPDVRPIQIVNTRSHWKPFSIFEPERTTKAYNLLDLWSKENPYHCRNHYPISQFKSDGQRYVAYIDRPTHTSLAETVGSLQKYEKRGGNSYAVRQMFGMTPDSVGKLVSLARSWNFAPKMEISGGSFGEVKYDIWSRAYTARASDNNLKQPITLKISASEKSPIRNFAVVLKNVKIENAKVFSNGSELKRGSDFFEGFEKELDATNTVFFFKISADSPLEIEIK